MLIRSLVICSTFALEKCLLQSDGGRVVSVLNKLKVSRCYSTFYCKFRSAPTFKVTCDIIHSDSAQTCSLAQSPQQLGHRDITLFSLGRPH